MPAEPCFINDKLELLVRRCIVFPADGSETRIVHMVARTVVVGDILPLLSYSRCVDMTSTFGDEYRKTVVTEHKTLDESTYLFFYNLSPNLPVNLNVAHVLGVTPSHLKTRKRLFWRGDVVAMKVQPESEKISFIVKSLNANPLDLKPLEEFFRKSYQEGRLESSLEYDECLWDLVYVPRYPWPTSLLPDAFKLSTCGVSKAEGEQFLYDLNELRSVIGRRPIPRPTYMKSYAELALDLYDAVKSALQRVTGPPKLPLELERLIFEKSALESPEVCTTLVLVARRVHVWIDPILIATVRMTGVERRDRLKLFLDKLNNGKPVEYYAQRVKNLFILDISQNQETKDILAICTGVENLVLWAHVDFFGNPHSGRNLRRLTIKLDRCFPPFELPHFYHPCFANLTHLHLYDEDEDWSTYPGWETLSSLTHLAFACSSSPEKIMQIMQMLPGVQYVALGSYNDRWGESCKYVDAAVDNRPYFRAAWGVRVVGLSRLPNNDWERGARGQGDFWDLVEQEVERRLKEESEVV